MTYVYEYPRPAVSTDCVVFGLRESTLQVLLIQRGRQPFQGQWALPGGFVEMHESLDAAAARELQEETGIAGIALEQFQAFGTVDRDPRTRVISVAYWGLVNPSRHPVRAASDAANAGWFPTSELPSLAFDHQRIVEAAWVRLKGRAILQPVGIDLLPTEFTLSELQSMYETILDRPLDSQNFQYKILESEILVALPQSQTDQADPAFYYRFDETAYRARTKQGFCLDI